MIAAMHLGIRKGIRGRWGLFILLKAYNGEIEELCPPDGKSKKRKQDNFMRGQ
jgi:hypothetical protein